MFPVYSLVPLVYLITLNYFSEISIFLRGLIYMFSFYILKIAFGLGIKKIIGNCPWDYSNYKIKIFNKKFKSNFKGIVCLQYAFVWYVYGILFEFYYLFLINI
jgi:hypothetical protein